MSRYMQVAREASESLRELYDLLPEESKEHGAELIVRVFNFGIRIAPRGVQTTVRIKAIQEAASGLPVDCSLVDRRNTHTGQSYKALVVTPKP